MKTEFIAIVIVLLTSCQPSDKQQMTRVDLENGLFTIGEMKDGVKDGKWYTILEKMNDTVTIELFKEGIVLHQTVIMSDGLRWEEKMADGKRNGPYELFQNDVKVESGYNINDTLNGWRIFYRPDGSIREKYDYNNGLPAEFFIYDENGNVSAHSEHFGKEPHIFQDSVGNEIYRIVFDRNQIDTIYNTTQR